MAPFLKEEPSHDDQQPSIDNTPDSESSMDPYDAEHVGEYYEGGFHPVQLGDMLNNGIYRIERKLGSGNYSTVWLATHRTLMCLRAIKICRADASVESWESFVLKQIKSSFPAHPWHLNLLEPETTFHLDGPNGRHACIVFPVTYGAMGSYSTGRTPGSIKGVIAQVLRGLALIHQAGFIHCDLHFGNIHVDTINNEQYTAAAALETNFPMDKKLDLGALNGGSTDAGIPRYIYRNRDRNFTNITPAEAVFKVADLGGAIEIGTNHGFHVTPLGLHAPEQIFNMYLDGKLDIWTLGCSIYEVVTRGHFVHTYSCPDSYSDESIRIRLDQLIKRLGPVPPKLRRQWDRVDEFLEPDGRPLVPGKFWSLPMPDCIFGVRCGLGEDDIEDRSEVAFYTIKREEKEVFVDFLSSMLRWQPTDRPTAEELLRHPWLRDSEG